MSRSAAPSWALLLVLCGAVFLEGLDIGMLNVALPPIRAELGLATGELQWVMSGYVLGYGGFMLLGGRAADLFGRRRMFLVPLTVFLVFSGLGGLATEGWMLIAARFVTGVCAAFMAPAGLSIITTGFPAGPRRDRALLVYSGTAGGGFSIGLVAGGLLTAADWRWVFFAPIAPALLVLLAALPLVPKDSAPRQPRPRVDVAGAITVTVAVLLLVMTVEQAAHAPALRTMGTLAAALALLAVFVTVERRTPTPLLRLGILRSRPLVRAGVMGLLFTAGFFGFQFLAVLYLQEFRGWSAAETSFALLPMGADAVLAPTLTPRLVRRFGHARVIVAGLLLAALGYALFLPVGADWTYAAMFPSLLLVGIAFALVHGPLAIVATDRVASCEQGLAGGLLYTSVQFGAALGLSAVTAVTTVAGGGDMPLTPLAGYRAGLIVPTAAVVIALLIGVLGMRERRPGRAVRSGRRASGSSEPAGTGSVTRPK
ncbi:MFS transporter [Streptomyces sp. SID8375]|uniref:MFS transporter n=1 Tax=unclassified Streptomyces TaxID=2593676 RepID=UPI00035CAB08|nr:MULTISPECIES: MFS transporter [unclassified Streptomyces]MYX07697.1 MFS transporter [Streptomyces sp. SID8375]